MIYLQYLGNEYTCFIESIVGKSDEEAQSHILRIRTIKVRKQWCRRTILPVLSQSF